MTDDQGLTRHIQQEFGLASPENSIEKLKELLSDRINHLMLHEPNTLISILYRLDVSETKLKQLLARQGSIESANAIAQMVIERQLQKSNSRNIYRAKGDGIDENERW